MAHQIHLRSDHQHAILLALLKSLEIKAERLKEDSLLETQAQYEGAAEKLLEPVVCGRHNKNIFVWLADQIRHTPRLRDQELGLHVLTICDVCARDKYYEYCEE